MPNLSASDVCGLLATALTGAQVTRQAWDVFRVDLPYGVSVLTWSLAIAQSIGLFVLSVSQHYWVAIGINFWVGIAAIIIVLRSARGWSAKTFSVCWPFVGIGCSVAVGGWTLAGTVGALASAFVWIPQAVRSWRVRQLSGLSAHSVAAGILASALWLVYAIAVDEWRLGIAPVSSLISLVITLYWVNRRGGGSR